MLMPQFRIGVTIVNDFVFGVTMKLTGNFRRAWNLLQNSIKKRISLLEVITTDWTTNFVVTSVNCPCGTSSTVTNDHFYGLFNFYIFWFHSPFDYNLFYENATNILDNCPLLPPLKLTLIVQYHLLFIYSDYLRLEQINRSHSHAVPLLIQINSRRKEPEIDNLVDQFTSECQPPAFLIPIITHSHVLVAVVVVQECSFICQLKSWERWRDDNDDADTR